MPISLEEAQQKLTNSIRPLPAETVPIFEAVGRISSAEILADNDLPSELRSAVDGYAVKPDSSGNYDHLLVVTQLKMGEVPSSPLLPGQAVGVLTGGLIPDEAVSIIPHEKVLIEDNYLKPLESVKPENNFKKPGEDFRKGEPILAKSARITPGLVALLAAFGHGQVQVYSRPRVSILSLGTNIIPCSNIASKGDIRDTNGPMLASLAKLDGAEINAVELSGARSKKQLKMQILQLLEQSDILVTTGGTYTDGVNEIHVLLDDIGALPLFREIPVQPGSHNGAAVLDSRIIISLSGNPASCAVGYNLFVAPAIRALQGINPLFPRITAVCTGSYAKKTGSRRFVRAQATPREDGWTVSIQPGQKPSMIRSLLDCNALIDLSPGHPAFEAGSTVSLILLDRNAI